MKKKMCSNLVIVIIVAAFLVVARPSIVAPYYDVVFVCGLDDFETTYGYEEFNSSLQKITSKLDLSYYYYRGSDLPRLRTNMLILFAHGNPYHTVLLSRYYSTKEISEWIDKTGAQQFVVESCFSGRFLSLPKSLSILASSNDTEASFRNVTIHISETGTYYDFVFGWGMLPFFIDHFSFNLTSAYYDIITDLEGSFVNQTIWTRTNNEVLSFCME